MQFLMIAKMKEGTPLEKVLPYTKPEAQKSWEFYAAGMIRQMLYFADMSGVVFLWEAESLQAVNEAIEEFPMKQSGVLEFEVSALKPYTAIGDLFEKKD